MGIRKQREAVWFEDKVEGNKGIYIDVERVQPQEIDAAGVDEAYRVQFIPLRKARHGLKEWILEKMPKFISDRALVETTNTIYPREALVGPRITKGNPEHGFEKEFIAYENQYGKAPYAKNHRDFKEEQITRVQKEAEDAQKDAARAEIENHSSKQEDQQRRGAPDKGRSPRDHNNLPGAE